MCVGGEGRGGNHEDSGNKRDNFTIFYSIWDHMTIYMTLLLAGSNKELPASAGDVRDVGLIAGLGIPPGGGHSNPLQYSCLESANNRGAWQAAVYRVAIRRD